MPVLILAVHARYWLFLCIFSALSLLSRNIFYYFFVKNHFLCHKSNILARFLR